MKQLFENWRNYLLDEARVDDVIERYPEHEDKVRYLSDNDPSDNDKYLAWMAKQHFENNEGLRDIINATQKFHNNRQRIDQKDIYQYKSLQDLESVVDNLGISKTQKRKAAKSDTIKQYEDDDWLIVSPMSKESSCIYGAGTRWCTAANKDNRFDNYDERGIILVYIHDKNDDPQSQYSKWALVYRMGRDINIRTPKQNMPDTIYDAQDVDQGPYILRRFYGEKTAENLLKVASLAAVEHKKIKQEKMKEEFLEKLRNNEEDEGAVQSYVMKGPLDKEVMGILIEKGWATDYTVSHQIIRRDDLSPELVMFTIVKMYKTQLSGDVDEYRASVLIEDLLKKYDIGSKFMKQITDLFKPSFLRNLAPMIANDEEWRNLILEKEIIPVLSRLMTRHEPPVDFLVKVRKKFPDNWQIQSSFVANSKIPEKFLRAHVKNFEEIWRKAAIIRNKRAPNDLLHHVAKLIFDRREEMHITSFKDQVWGLLRHPNTEEETLRLVAKHSDDEEAAEAARNPKASKDFLLDLAKSSSRLVSDTAKEQLRDRFGDLKESVRPHFNKFKNIF